MRSKGISELIAVVLLIAFVIATAVLISTFTSTFTRDQITKVREEGGATVDCAIANLEIDPDSVLIASSSLYVTVKNTGREDLTDIDVVFRNTTTSEFQTADTNTSLTSGSIKTITVSGFTAASVNRVIVKSNCPGVGDTVENVSGTFKRVT